MSDVPLNTSIFTRLFAARAQGDIGGFPETKIAFLDALTGTSLTRAELLHLSLSFGYGIKDHPITAPFTKPSGAVCADILLELAGVARVAAGLRCTFTNNAYVCSADSGASLVITAENGIEEVRAMFHELGIPREEGDRRTIALGCDLRWAGGPAVNLRPECHGLISLADLLVRGKLEREEQFEGALAHETAYLCYNSGTTSRPKGVEVIFSRRIQTLQPSWMSSVLFSSMSRAMPPSSAFWMVGCHSIPIRTTPILRRHRVLQDPICNHCPPVLVVLARHPGTLQLLVVTGIELNCTAVDGYDLSSLEYMLCAAASLGAELVKQVKIRLLRRVRPHEASTATHLIPFSISDKKVGSVGTLRANLEARIVHHEEGTVDSETGALGQKSRNSITQDGWFKTGDVVVRDNHSFFYIIDRKKELIKYKRIVSTLESILLTHPDIVDAAVIEWRVPNRRQNYLVRLGKFSGETFEASQARDGRRGNRHKGRNQVLLGAYMNQSMCIEEGNQTELQCCGTRTGFLALDHLRNTPRIRSSRQTTQYTGISYFDCIPSTRDSLAAARC
ncbi:hypothetical protein C8R45DRAFT_918056 [Mycena sanguinolenta]|nr:hypothetical protein C8R45DRAFT_918056 [Mycena sanguinolenta]